MLRSAYQETHRQNIYCAEFNTIDPRFSRHFASVGHNTVTVYECIDRATACAGFAAGSIRPLWALRDPEAREYLYCVAWSLDRRDGRPLLCVAGQSGAIRVIDCHACCVVRTLMGHGNAVNELRIHPRRPELLVSASKDESVRMWNIQTGVCVCVFAGEQGHRDQVRERHSCESRSLRI